MDEVFLKIAHQRQHALAVGLKAGISIGVVTAVAIFCTPFVEWIADLIPEKRMGVIGIGLIPIGFASVRSVLGGVA